MDWIEAALEAAVASFREQITDRQAWAEWLREAPEAVDVADLVASATARPVSMTEQDRAVARSLAGRLNGAPGGGLAGAVQQAVFAGAGGAGGVLAELSDAEHMDLVLAIERLHRWTAYTRGRVMLALADRWAGRIPTDHHDPTGTEVTGTEHRPEVLDRCERVQRRLSRRMSGDRVLDEAILADAFTCSEVAWALGVSETMTTRWPDTARALAETDRLPATGAALRTGVLDWPKAHEITTATLNLTPGQATTVEALVLPDACLPIDPDTGRIPPGATHPIRTVPALREHLASAVAAVDPTGTLKRARRARAGSRVWFTLTDHTMGELHAELPLEWCAAIKSTLDAAVAQARRAKDPRTPDQIRADVLTHILTHNTLTGGGTPRPHRRHHHHPGHR